MFYFQDPIVRVNNYIKHRLEREVELYNLINKSPAGSLSVEEIVNEMYKASLNFIISFHFITI